MRLASPRMWLLREIKEVWGWIGFFWQVITILGFASVITGTAGAVWAVTAGIPLPIAVMAGFFTLVGAFYLGIAPFALRTFLRPPSSAAPGDPNPEVNYCVRRQ